MSEKKEIKVVVQIKQRFVSVNALYKARVMYVKGRPIATVYKNSKANEIERDIREQLRAIDFSEYKNWLRTTPWFKLHIQFIFKKNVTHSDVSNYFKNVEDICTRFIKEDLGIDNYDDSKHVEISASKSIIPKSKHEYACIYLTESKFNMRLDQIDTPDKFYIGPELDEFKKEIKKEFKERKLKIIDKLENKDQCNSLLYILTPKSKNQILEVANIINVVWECLTSESGFVFIGVKDKEDWPDDLKTQLEDMIKLVKSISGSSSRIKIGYINEIKDILDL